METNSMTQETGSAKVRPSNIRIRHRQDERRQALIDQQREIRIETDKRRKSMENDEDCQQGLSWMEKCAIDDERPLIRDESYEIVMSLMKSEFMSTVPEDIDDWIATLCPVGKHCSVVIQDNCTKVFNKFGTMINCFQSLFPQTIPMNHPSYRKRTILDCIYNNKLKKYYILDIIEWMGGPFDDFEAKHRFSFIQKKINSTLGIGERSDNNCYPFEFAPRMIASKLYPLLLDNFQFFPENVKLDGINFYYAKGLYTPGDTPLVLWLNPFMIPDILKKPVHDKLALKPLNYDNIEYYIQNLNRKCINPFVKILRKRHYRGKCSMVLDDLGEVETDEDPDIENDLTKET